MKQKGLIGLVLVCLLVLLLTGCGQTVESKAAYVQEQNEIAVNDVVQLLTLEGLQVDRMEPSGAFAAQFPGVQICRINGDNLLLLKATTGSLYDRNHELASSDWEFYWYDQEKPSAMLEQVQKDYGLEEKKYYSGRGYGAKNIIAGYFTCIAPEFLQETVTKEMQEEKVKEVTAVTDKVSRVFDYDINGMQEYAVTAEGNYFSVEGTLYYYQTPYTAGKSTMYDMSTDIHYTATVKDEIFTKYQGQDMTLRISQIAGMAGKSAGSRELQTLLDKKSLTGNLNDCSDITGQKYAGPIQYEVTFSVGDISETVTIGVEEAATAEATAPAQK